MYQRISIKDAVCLLTSYTNVTQTFDAEQIYANIFCWVCMWLFSFINALVSLIMMVISISERDNCWFFFQENFSTPTDPWSFQYKDTVVPL